MGWQMNGLAERWMDGLVDRWMDGLVDRQTDSSQKVTTWQGRAVWEVMDGTQERLRGRGFSGEGRKEGWMNGWMD
jgi:hypothetical protein